MTTTLPKIAADYVDSINDKQAPTFLALFAADAVVDDAGREFRGLGEIEEWSQREIFAAEVTLEVLGVADRDGQTVITSKVDGNFDRTGLPDPLIIDHQIALASGKIVELTCRLAGGGAAS